MKIVYSGIVNNYFDPNRGKSFEYNNFFLTLQNMKNVSVINFPFDRLLVVGREKMNEELLALIEREKPDIFFAFMFQDELDIAVLDEIKKYTTSVAWFSDDHWRFDSYSKHYASHFSYAVTTYLKAVDWYKEAGIQNVIYLKCACNDFICRPINIEKSIDVSFVGQFTPARARIIKHIRKEGISVFVRGTGWPDGRVSQDEMIEIFSKSKINLNLNSPSSGFNFRSLAHIFFRRKGDNIVPDFFNIFSNIKIWFQKRTPQLKARLFEIAGCRGFCISGYTDDANLTYCDGKEVVYYKDTEDLIKKIRYYLDNPSYREKIALAAYKRTVEEHTYTKRFEELFKKVGFSL